MTTTTTHFVLVPGLWLGAWAWDRVAESLRGAGHLVTAVTLPGLEPTVTDRSMIGLSDHIESLAATVADAGPSAVLVAHSGAGKVASGVLDRDPQAVQRAIYVDSGPSADGDGEEVPPEVTERPLPTWDEFAANGASLDGLSPADLETFRARAVPHPAAVLRDRIELHHDDARRAVPSTIIACSIPAAVVADLAREGHAMFAEVAQLTDLDYLDLPTGHWPMWSRPTDLADALLRSVATEALVPELS